MQLQPKCIKTPDATTWRLNRRLHRTDGPAIEYPNGSKYWYLNGKRHRTDGPAIECASGEKYWYLNDERHRTDGPAVERPDGTKEWWIEGKRVTPKTLVYLGYMTEEELMLILL